MKTSFDDNSRQQTRLGMAFVLLVVLASLAFALTHPLQAFALTWSQDGVTSIGAADCVIVADFRTPTAVSIEGSALKRDGINLYAVYEAPQGGGSWSAKGSIYLTYNKGVLDKNGTYHNLHVKITDVNGIWKDGLTTTPKRANVRQRIAYLANGFIAVRSYDDELSYQGTSLGTYASATGMNCHIYAWIDDAGAGLAYNLLMKDIDQPNHVAHTASGSPYSGPWQERVGLRSSELKAATIHVEKNTYLTNSSNVIMGTKDADSSVTGSIYTAAFSARITLTGSEPSSSPDKGFAIGWSGSQCETRIFEDLTHAIVTKAGIGGTCQQIAGNDASATPIALTQQSISDGSYVTRTDLEAVPKNNYTVTVTPEEGYTIDTITLDGTAIEVLDNTRASLSLPTITADHVVTATFAKIPDEQEPGTLSLHKASSKPSITTDNPCYTLEGAQYGVYTDRDCTDQVATLTTNAEGQTQSVALPDATYYVRESSAAPGYHLDQSVYEALLTAGTDVVVDAVEEPGLGTTPLKIHKVDGDTNTAEPQGSASLEGAQFCIAFYAGHYGSAGELPEEPLRSWTVQTDELGEALLDTAHLVEGDDLFLDDEDNAVLPLGTLAITETQAPKGYAAPAEPLVFLAQLIMDSNEVRIEPLVGSKTLDVTVSEPICRGGLRLKKVDAEGKPLAGARFAIKNASAAPIVVNGTSYQPGEVCLTIESRSEGLAETASDALPFGSYEVVEQQAPQGYRTNQSWHVTAEISKDGQMVDLTDKALVNDAITTDVVITAQKNFDGSSQHRNLEKGLFTFTLSDEDGTVIDTKTNDEKGLVTFDALNFGYQDLDSPHTYTIAEVPGDDEEIVYDTHVESVTITLDTDDTGELVSHIQTDDDGIVFENHTIGSVNLPLTGEHGIASGALASFAACAAAALLYARQLRKAC